MFVREHIYAFMCARMCARMCSESVYTLEIKSRSACVCAYVVLRAFTRGVFVCVCVRVRFYAYMYLRACGCVCVRACAPTNE